MFLNSSYYKFLFVTDIYSVRKTPLPSRTGVYGFRGYYKARLKSALSMHTGGRQSTKHSPQFSVAVSGPQRRNSSEKRKLREREIETERDRSWGKVWRIKRALIQPCSQELPEREKKDFPRLLCQGVQERAGQ